LSGHDLAKIALFERLDVADLERLETILVRETFPEGTVIFFEGDTSDSLFGILAGSVKVFRTTDDGEECILDILGAHDVFGEYSLIDGQPRSASVATLEESTLLSISHRAFRTFVSDAPDVLWKVLESFTDRMRRQTQEMMELSRQRLSSRLVQVLLRIAEKYGRPLQQGCRIGVRLTAQSLAEMTASTGDRVSRILDRLESEGLIAISARELTILDLTSLRRSLEYLEEPVW
jgi:CRP/FNR family transcriptional regulator/CRP/FNR family cyclic AMP-dependent transcriptional regulator